MPFFVDGPQHGSTQFDPSVDTPSPSDPQGMMPMGPPLPSDQGQGQGSDGALQALLGGYQGGAGPQAGGEDIMGSFDALSDEEKFKTLMNLISSWQDGLNVHQDKLLVEKARTLFQQIAANEEKALQTASNGTMDPRVTAKAYGGR